MITSFVKLTVIIPIYNEENTCRQLIEKVKSVPIQKQIIVIDDGSTDDSSNILKKIHGIELITHETNKIILAFEYINKMPDFS